MNFSSMLVDSKDCMAFLNAGKDCVFPLFANASAISPKGSAQLSRWCFPVAFLASD